MTKTRKKVNEALSKYYKNLEEKKVIDTIFNGTLHNWGNMIEWVNNFNEERRKGKYK